MTPRVPFKRLILRAVLRNVSPMVIRVVAMPDCLDLPDFDDVFRAILGWDGLGFIFRVQRYGNDSPENGPLQTDSCLERFLRCDFGLAPHHVPLKDGHPITGNPARSRHRKRPALARFCYAHLSGRKL
jgi:hypothetical protein